jgi:hypothetical protein
MRRLVVTASVVPSSTIVVTLIMETINSSETSVFIRDARHNIPEEGIIQSHLRETLKYYIELTDWAL